VVQNAQEGGTVTLKKKSPRRLPRYPSLIYIPELAICLIGQAHVTKMKLNLKMFPVGIKLGRQVIVFSRSPWFVQI